MVDGVCGKGKAAPPIEDMNDIIQSGNGILLDSMPICTLKSETIGSIIIICTSELMNNCDESWVNDPRILGIFTPEMIFVSILRQSLDLENYKLDPSLIPKSYLS
jgi:hypothetical protein